MIIDKIVIWAIETLVFSFIALGIFQLVLLPGQLGWQHFVVPMIVFNLGRLWQFIKTRWLKNYEFPKTPF